MIKIGISIVSHNDHQEIINNHRGYISDKQIDFKVCVTDNTGSKELKKFCFEQNYFYVLNTKIQGFGENNNQNIRLLEDRDLLLIVNPDVKFDLKNFKRHAIKIYKLPWHICGARVIEKNRLQKSSHRRLFPALLDPAISFTLKKKFFLLDPNISSEVDWVGGSFMLVRTNVFLKLNGFNPEYFMYYEDVDFCKRAKKMGYRIYYFSNFSFFHGAQRAGHRWFSKAFWWNLKSMIKYFVKHPTIRLLGPNKY